MKGPCSGEVWVGVGLENGAECNGMEGFCGLARGGAVSEGFWGCGLSDDDRDGGCARMRGGGADFALG